MSDNFLKEKTKKIIYIDKTIKDIEKKLKPAKEQIKNLKKEKKEIENEIIPIIRNLNKSNEKVNAKVNIQVTNESGSEDTIKYISKNSLVSITKDVLKNKFIEFFTSGPGSEEGFVRKKSEDKGIIMYDFIYSKENREHKIVEKIETVI